MLNPPALMNTRQNSTSWKILAVALMASSAVAVHSTGAAVQYTEPFTWTALYDASALPLEPAAVSYSDGTSGAFVPVLDNPDNLNASLGAGVLRIDSSNRGVVGIDVNQPGRLLLNSDVGYTAEFRVRLIRSVNITGDSLNLNGACLQLNDGRDDEMHNVHLGLFTHPTTGENWARVRGGTLSPAIRIGEDFHTFTFVVTASETTLYVDGYQAATVSRWLAIHRPEVWLGTFQTNSNHIANFEVAYLKLYDGGAVHPVNIGPYDYRPTMLVEPRPEMTGFGRDGSDFLLSFKSVLGGSYLVEARDDLTQALPNETSAGVVGTGAVVTASDSMDGVDRRFYQVRREPEVVLYESEFTWDFRYEGDVDPLSSSAVQLKDGTTRGFTRFRTVANKYRNEDGILSIAFPPDQAEGGAFDFPTYSWEPFFLDPAVGYTVEYRVRVDYAMHYGATVLELNATDVNHLVQVAVVTETAAITDPDTGEVVGTEPRNVVRLQSAGGTLARDYPLGKGFNTLTLTVKDDVATVFINGVEAVSTTAILKTQNRNFIRLGSATGPANLSRYDVDYLRIYAGGAVRPVSPLED
jgi:hypothetical protein